MQPGTTELSKHYLLTLPPTAELEVTLARLTVECDQARASAIAAHQEMQQDGLAGSLAAEMSRRADAKLVRLRGAISMVEFSIEHARERDRIQAARPEGCTCLGLLATGSRFVPGPNGAEDATEVHEWYCQCPEGQAIKAQDDAVVHRYAETQRAIKLARFVQRAKVPNEYRDATFESYPAVTGTQQHVAYLRTWAESFTPIGDSVMLWGEPNTGKTGLAVATMREVVARHGTSAWFTTVVDLLDEIRDTYDQPRKRQVMHAKDDIEEQVTTRQLQDAVKEVPLLILDDLGVERPSEWVIEELYKLLNHRYNDNKRTIFTSNLSPTQLNARLGERIVWRIVKMCGSQHTKDGVRHVIGPNLRVMN